MQQEPEGPGADIEPSTSNQGTRPARAAIDRQASEECKCLISKRIRTNVLHVVRQRLVLVLLVLVLVLAAGLHLADDTTETNTVKRSAERSKHSGKLRTLTKSEHKEQHSSQQASLAVRTERSTTQADRQAQGMQKQPRSEETKG